MTRRVAVLSALFVTAVLSAQDRGATAPPPAATTGAGPTTGSARVGEIGKPVIHNYTPTDYGGGTQNWAILQDGRGVMYFGASNGLLEFDGATWRTIKLPNRSTVRSLAMDDRGRVYVGSVAELGYLEPDASGEMQFVSLTPKLPAGSPTFEDVWRLFVAPEGVYFQTQNAIFRWKDGAFKVWKPQVRFGRASFANGRFYVPQPGLGIFVMEQDELKLLPGTQSLSTEAYSLVLPLDGTRLLFGTQSNGFLAYDGTSLTPFPTEVDPLIKASRLYRGLVLPDGTFALTTTLGGMAIIDRAGHKLVALNKESGLLGDGVYYAMRDRQGALWVAMAIGLARVETPSPASFFDETDGLRDSVQDMIRHDGRFYVATGRGSLYLKPRDGAAPPRFMPVKGLTDQTWTFLTVTDPTGARKPELLLAASDGLFTVEGDTATNLIKSVGRSYNAATLEQSRINPDRVWVGLFDGLASVRRINGRWVNEGRIDGITEQVRSLAEDDDGTVWGGTQAAGVVRVRFDGSWNPGTPRPPVGNVVRYGKGIKLPAGQVRVFSIAHKTYFHAFQTAMLQYDEQSDSFVKNDTFSIIEPGTNGGLGLREAPNGDVYIANDTQVAVLRKQPDGSYKRADVDFQRFWDGGFLYPETDGVIWFAVRNMFYRFDSAMKGDPGDPAAALVRRVTANEKQPVFGGATPFTASPLGASTRSLRFEFAAPTFFDEKNTQYRSRLEGLDSAWSEWNKETKRDYTNLGFGKYTFHVEAKDVRGRISPEATYAFTILPPWYRTWWADGLYVVLFGLVAFGIDRLQRYRVIKRERDRAQFKEAKYRAEAAEALAKSESERKKNIELLGQVGREITASLDFDTIFAKLYDRMNQFADADVFGVGLYHPEKHEIEYRLAIEQGKRYAPYSRDTTNRDQFPVWCIEHRQAVFINDVETEYSKYINRKDEERRPLEDGTMATPPQSLIYLPLISKDKVLGVISIQSFEKNAYSENQLNIMEGLASYTAIALDNAAAYRQLNEQENEIRRLFEEAERARALAEEADAAKSAFLSTVSHELRTPLTSVLGFAKIIKKRLEERLFPLITTDDKRVRQTMLQVEENLKVVVSEGERLTKLIDDVLDLAKIEAGKLEWHMDSVQMTDVIEQATSATSSLFDQKGLTLVKDVEPDLPAVTADHDRIIQVVINLISNAVKFTDTGSVTCRARRVGGDIVVSVIDTGMGISEADQPKVFERFKQVGDTLTDKPKGTGLGLPICREIVEHHGGRVWVESELGTGSTFSFAIPIDRTGVSTDNSPVALAALIRQLRDQVVVSTPRSASRQPSILVVDDEANIRELLTQEFTEAGYQVRTAANGREAIATVRQSRPDLIVLDVMMPEMNGFDVAAVLKNDPATLDIPIVIVSIVQDKERGFRIGVDRYLTKPIDTELLFREVDTLIEQKKSRKRVLVVDQDATTVRTLADVLQSRGYSVSEARGEDLMEKAKALQPDIIMMNSGASAQSEVVRLLRFEKGLENVIVLVYQ